MIINKGWNAVFIFLYSINNKNETENKCKKKIKGAFKIYYRRKDIMMVKIFAFNADNTIFTYLVSFKL